MGDEGRDRGRERVEGRGQRAEGAEGANASK
jgi:hypothetical protein